MDSIERRIASKYKSELAEKDKRIKELEAAIAEAEGGGSSA